MTLWAVEPARGDEDLIDRMERETRDSVAERRNFFLGLWAGQLLGYEGNRLALYAGEVMASDMTQPGPDDVIGRLVQDFAAHGVPLGAADVRAQLQRSERLVRSELLSTD